MTTTTAVREGPILMSGPMVRATLADLKTQTRRIIKPQPPEWVDQVGVDCFCGERQFAGRGTHPTEGRAEKFINAKYWHGDQLWVREAWSHINDFAAPGSIVYRADAHRDDSGERDGWWINERFYRRDFKWKPSIFMQRWASRITLEVLSVKVERVQEISVWDAYAEGISKSKTTDPNPRASYRALWDSLHGPGAWDRNDWVFVISFRRLEPA